MTLDRLTDKIGEYLVRDVSTKVASPLTKFALGAVASESGKRILAAKIAPLVAMLADASGEFSSEAVKDLLLSGIKASGKMPILGGLITVDENDVRDFCGGLA